MKKMYVKWHDATHYEFLNPEEVDKLEFTVFENVGFLVKETKEFIALAFSYHNKIEYFDDGKGINQYKRVLLIPKSQIIEIKELK